MGAARYEDNRMAIVTSGVVKPIDIGAGFKVIIRDNGKMVFYASECRDLDLTGYFILHFLSDTVGSENRDFAWPTRPSTLNRNPFSKHFGSCYTEVLLPSYKAREFRTGQYDFSNTG